MEYVYLNDGILPGYEAKVSIHDGGLLHGVGLFETMRSYNGVVFRLDRHLDRLWSSAEALGIAITQSREAMEYAVAKVLESNKLLDARIRITVTPGNLKRTLEREEPCSTLLVTATHMAGYPSELYRYGIMVILSRYKHPRDLPSSGHKTTQYQDRLFVLHQAQQAQAHEALWFTPENRLAEGCISNVFIVDKGKVRTPPLDAPVLPGIIRREVFEIAREEDIEVEEALLTVHDLMGAEEVFLTNSIMELMPVRRIEQHVVGEEEPGEITKTLHEGYKRRVQELCGRGETDERD